MAKRRTAAAKADTKPKFKCRTITWVGRTPPGREILVEKEEAERLSKRGYLAIIAGIDIPEDNNPGGKDPGDGDDNDGGKPGDDNDGADTGGGEPEGGDDGDDAGGGE